MRWIVLAMEGATMMTLDAGLRLILVAVAATLILVAFLWLFYRHEVKSSPEAGTKLFLAALVIWFIVVVTQLATISLVPPLGVDPASTEEVESGE